jgi:SAM-dependent methyltransferase
VLAGEVSGGPPSPWVQRFASLVPAGAPVLDLAAGRGRHTRMFAALGHPVTAVDLDTSGLAGLAGDPLVESLAADLERGDPFPLAGRRFGGVVVTNYLHRPLLDDLVAAVGPGGVLIYETFAEGNEVLGGRVTNPDFLLRPGELLELARGRLRVIAYEDVVVGDDRPAAVQRICAVRPITAGEEPVRTS